MQKESASYQEIEDAIIDLYLRIKIRKEVDIANYTQESFKIEKNRLKASTPLLTIINYLKTNIEVLISTRVSAQLNTITISSKDEDIVSQYQGANEYERLLRRYEADIRGYISVINKLRINLNGLISKNEQLEKLAFEFENMKNNPMIEVKDYQKEIHDLNILVKTYEKNNLMIPVLEKKLKKQKIELNNYQQKIRSYSKKIEEYERDSSMTSHDETMTNQCELGNCNDMTMANCNSHIGKEANSVRERNRSGMKKSHSILAMMTEGRQNRDRNNKMTKMIPKCNSIVYLKDHFKNNTLKKKNSNNMSFSSRDKRNIQSEKSIINNYTIFDTISQVCSCNANYAKENNSKFFNDQHDTTIINNKLIDKRLCASGFKGKRTMSKGESILKK